MIEVKGRFKKVLSSSYYEWVGVLNGEWEERGSVDVGLDSAQMEVGIDWDDIDVDPYNEWFEAFFLTTDWENRETDYSDDTLPFSLNQTIMDNLLASRGTRANNPYTSPHVHPNDVENSDGGNLDVTDIDEDAPGDGVYEKSGDKNDPNVDWIEVYFPSAGIPSSATINNITYYYGYYTNDGWELTTDALSNITWRVDATQKDLGNYTLSSPPDDDIDATLAQLWEL
jgi:hypothetical protein